MRSLYNWKKMSCLCATLGVLLASSLHAQVLTPASRFNAESGNWSQGSNWNIAETQDDGSFGVGADPLTGAPDSESIASIRNGGVVTVDSDVDEVMHLSVANGTVVLAGGSVNVTGQTLIGESGTLSLGGGSLTTDSLSIGGSIDLAASLAGDLAFGTSVPVATAASVTGAPRVITVDGAEADLAAGLALSLVNTAEGAAVVVESLPALEVDRVTGGVKIVNMGTGPLDIKGYSMSSEGELIARARGASWDSLADQGMSGWAEANPTRTTRFSEVNIGGSTTIPANGSIDLGTPYSGIGAGPRDEDLQFEFILGDGRVGKTDVVYTGPINDFTLVVDPETGAAQLSNPSTLTPAYEVASYAITSQSGALNAEGFNGIGEDGWDNANPQATALSDLNLRGAKTFTNGSSIDLGNIFTPGGEQDLVFQYSTDANILRTGTIIYGEPDSSGGGNGTPTCADIAATRLPGDADGSGDVGFLDFLALANNFGSEGGYEQGNFDCSGTVSFLDFLTLANNFGKSAGDSAAAVPEPSSGLLIFLGILGMLNFRKRPKQIAAVAAVCLCCATMSQDASADLFDGRFIRLHPDGANGQINNMAEARAIAAGTVSDVLIGDDITFEVEVIDFGGGAGTFTFDESSYPNVPDGEIGPDQNDVMMIVSGVVEIPEGEWSIGCGSDDGCFVNLPGVSFGDTFAENGAGRVDGDGEIIYNGTRGHAWTVGNFVVPSGGIKTGFEAGFFERGGGDSFEVAILDEHALDQTDFADIAGELIADDLWTVTGESFAGAGNAADFDGNGVIDQADADILIDNFGEGTMQSQGDINGDGAINLADVAAFAPIFAEANPAAASVPEPGALSLVLLGLGAIPFLRKRRVRALAKSALMVAIAAGMFVGVADTQVHAQNVISLNFDDPDDPRLDDIVFFRNGQLDIDGDALREDGGIGDSGFLSVTDAENSQNGAILLPDLSDPPGSALESFKITAELRVGGGTPRPADGFSFNLIPLTDPLIYDVDFEESLVFDEDGVVRDDARVGQYAGVGNEASLPEEGSRTGLSIGFDEWQSGARAPEASGERQSGEDGDGEDSCGEWMRSSDGTEPITVENQNPFDCIGISVRVDGLLVAQAPFSVLNGEVDDQLSLQTGPAGAPAEDLDWATLEIQVTPDLNDENRSFISVSYKDRLVIDDSFAYRTAPGRLFFGGRTGGANANHHIDDVVITTDFTRVLLGDFNDDGIVNLDDYGILVSNMNTVDKQFSDGDMDFNGRVNISDFVAFRKEFARSGSVEAAIPEPSTGILAALAAMSLGLFRRRRS